MMRKRLLATLSMLSILISIIPPVMALELERPGGDIQVDERTENAFTDGKAAVGLGVHAEKYYENDPDFPANGKDYLKLRISATANTRKILEYAGGEYSYDYSWHDNLPYTLPLGDDRRTNISKIADARFYGGPGSGEYNEIWVSSNGVVSYDPNTFTDPTVAGRYYGHAIPDENGLNAFIAPLWMALRPELGGSITWGFVYHHVGGVYKPFLCVSWNNIQPRDFYVPEGISFQVLIQHGWDFGTFRQSRIWFQYKTITDSILDDSRVVVGIEDQQGAKGVSIDKSQIGNDTAFVFDQSSHFGLIDSLSIRMNYYDAYAQTKIDENSETIRGYNVILAENLPDEDLTYKLALSGFETLLESAGTTVVGETVEAAGIMAGTAFISLGSGILIGIGLTALEYYAQQQKKAILFDTDHSTHAKRMLYQREPLT